MSDNKVKGIRFINHYNRGDAQHSTFAAQNY